MGFLKVQFWVQFNIFDLFCKIGTVEIRSYADDNTQYSAGEKT